MKQTEIILTECRDEVARTKGYKDYKSIIACHELIIDREAGILAQQRTAEAFAEWIAEQKVMIAEDTKGKHYRSSMIGGKKYSVAELFELFNNQ